MGDRLVTFLQVTPHCAVQNVPGMRSKLLAARSSGFTDEIETGSVTAKAPKKWCLEDDPDFSITFR